jgi:hypothetical protein
MSYDTAKQALRKNLDVILQGKSDATPQDYLIYELAKALFDLIGALEADLAEIKSKIDQLGGGPLPRQ